MPKYLLLIGLVTHKMFDMSNWFEGKWLGDTFLVHCVDFCAQEITIRFCKKTFTFPQIQNLYLEIACLIGETAV